MQRAIDMVMNVVEPGRGALAHALSIVTVPASAREPRDQCRAEEPLCIDYGLMRLCSHRARERADLTPGRRVERRRAPAPRGDRNDTVDSTMQPDQRRESLFHHPADARLRPMPPRIAHCRHVMDHIAKRGGLDEEDVGHQAGPGREQA